MVAPAMLYFLIHALHDRVQGNWPSFLYPAFAIAAAAAYEAVSKAPRPNRFLCDCEVMPPSQWRWS